MAQHDYNLANENGADLRADLNAALAAIVSNNSAATEPATTFAFQYWLDTSSGDVLKIRNAANSAWVVIGDATLANLGFFLATGGTISGDTIFSSTGYLQLPRGTVAQRPGTPLAGMIRYNSDNGQVESYVNSAWQPIALGILLSSARQAANYTLAASVSASAMTVALKDLGGSNPSATSPVYFGMRSSTASSGLYFQRSVTAALSVVIASGATLGQKNATSHYIYVYAIDNAGVIELAVSSKLFADSVVVSTTIMNGSATDGATMYSTAARTGVACRLIGRLLSNQTTAGTYAATPTQISIQSEAKEGVNFAISASSSGAFTGASTSLTDITNCNASIVSRGGPLRVELMPDNDGGSTNILGIKATNDALPQGWLYFICTRADGSHTDTPVMYLSPHVASASTDDPWITVAPSSAAYVYDLAPGAYVFKAQYIVVSGSTTTFFATNVKMRVTEIT